MKFGRNLIKNDQVRVTTVGQTDRQAKNNKSLPTFVGRALTNMDKIRINCMRGKRVSIL